MRKLTWLKGRILREELTDEDLQRASPRFVNVECVRSENLDLAVKIRISDLQ